MRILGKSTVTSLRVALAFSLSAAACTSILGDFQSGTDPGGGATGGTGGGVTAALSLSVPPDTVRVLRGSSVAVTVTVTRVGGVGDVTLTLGSAPTGVTATPVVVPAGVTSAQLTLDVAATAPPGAATTSVVDADGLATPASLALLIADSPGTLDASFDLDGVVTILPPAGTTSGAALRAVVQPDGALVVGGTRDTNTGWVVMRIDSAGVPDAAFNSQVVAALPTTGQLFGIALDAASGKIVLSGVSNTELTVVRIHPTGAADQAFGNGGVVRTTTIEYPQGATGRSVVVQPDSKIVVAGSNIAGTSQGIVLRYDDSGTRDVTFANGGTFEDKDETLFEGVLLDSNGSIVAAGQDRTTSPPTFWATRLLADGTRDPGFGTGGGVSFGPGFHSTHEVVLQPSGHLVLCGEDHIAIIEGSLGRLTPSGALGWPGGGTINYSTFGNTDRILGCAATRDGKILFSGYGSDAQNNEGYVVRLDANGVEDPTFGTAGVVTFGVPTPPPPAYSLNDVLELPDGRIVTVGNKNDVGWFIARIWN